MKKIYLYSIGLWFLFAIVASLNGYIRNETYKNIVGDLAAHQISTVIFILIILFVMYLFLNKTGLKYTNSDLWIIGASWLLATIIFEFMFGHYVFGNSWEKLLMDYNIFEGRVWIFVLLFTLIGPWLVAKKK